MTTRFVGGPADGVELTLGRTPLFLRLVREETIVSDWLWHALDRVDDQPKSTETVYVYRWAGDGRYEFYDAKAGREVLADTARWREWCVAEREMERMAEAKVELNARFEAVGRARDAIVAHLGGPWKKGTPGAAGLIDCPACGGVKTLGFTRSGYNGHVHAACKTPKCVSWVE